MATVGEIRDFFDGLAPFSMKLEFDNVGLLCGFPETEVRRVLAALDITDAVIGEAAAWGAQLIVSHHPLLFHPARAVVAGEDRGRKLISLVRGEISALCLHTNLDAAEGGVNDCLMEALGGTATGTLSVTGAYPDGRPCGIGRVGNLPEPVPLETFLARTKGRLGCNGLRYVGEKPVYRLACCGGAGGSELEAVLAAGCDTYVTADLKYDQFLYAREAGLNLIDADHFCTENVVVPRLKAWLDARFPEVETRIARSLGQTVQLYV